MALWEYKVITSGLHGFASPALLEAHLNTLAKDEWEIVIFQTQPNNPLAFNGLARRATVRDWSPPPEPIVAAPTASPASATTKTYEPPKPVAAGPARAEEPAAAAAEEKADANGPSRENTLRTFRDTERDSDPDAEDDDWDEWDESAEALPTFFEALKPHLRRNQKGVGMSVAVDYLAKRWDQRENDLIGALKECGFSIPETEETDPDYFEFEGDLYWVNRNNRGQLFINTREKPRPVFRTAQAKKLDPNDPATAELVAERAAEKADIDKRKTEREERTARQAAAQAAAAAAREAAKEAANQGPAISDQDGAAEPSPKSEEAPAGPLPIGQDLLDRIRPLMRRNRRGPGYSGSVSFLARALKHGEADVAAALAALGLNPPANPADKSVYVEIGDGVYWMNKDNRGGVWINGREKREGGSKPGENNGGHENGGSENTGRSENAAADASFESATKASQNSANVSEDFAGPAAGEASTLAPTDVNAAADAAANSAVGGAAGTVEMSGSGAASTESAPSAENGAGSSGTKSSEAKPSAGNGGAESKPASGSSSAISPSTAAADLASSPADAPFEGVPPAREVVPQPASSGGADDGAGSGAASTAADANTAEVNAVGSDEEGAKPKTARPRKPSARPRTRKAKTDTDTAGGAPVPESDVASEES